MTSAARVRSSVDGRVGTLELTGRGDANAMDPQMIQELDRCVLELSEAADARAIDLLVIRALGRNFSVGGDLDGFASAPNPTAHIEKMAAVAHRAIRRLYELDIPVIARWQGAAAGGGIGLLLVADIIVADRTATMTGGYAAAGLTPDAGVSWVLPRMLGSARALSILLTNKRLGAQDLLMLGVVSQVTEPGDLDASIDMVTEALLRVPGSTARATKRLTAIVAGDTIAAHLDIEAATIAERAGSTEFRETLGRYRKRAGAAGHDDH